MNDVWTIIFLMCISFLLGRSFEQQLFVGVLRYFRDQLNSDSEVIALYRKNNTLYMEYIKTLEERNFELCKQLEERLDG